jgi:farnesyl diphosphate synthase
MTTQTTKLKLDELRHLCTNRLNTTIDVYLQDIPSLELKAAMQYTMQQGGKRLRPLLIFAAGATFNATPENLAVPAAAVEIIHTYSLIHDDLPCMDNADLRRGQPTCHKVYNDGLAVLTGDALNTLAMQIIADHPSTLKAERRLRMISVLGKACGPYGMAAGQALDLTVLNDPSISKELLLDIYRLKTGALFTACIELGRLASSDDDEINEAALQEFGDHIGLAFQIQDDILDIETNTQTLGKPQGIDAINNKMTYPHLLGMQAAKEKVESLYQQALESIDYLGDRAYLLRELAKKMLQRDR